MEKNRCHCCGRELDGKNPVWFEAPGSGYGKVCWNICKACRNKVREKSRSANSSYAVCGKGRH
ncbi:MAG: hypothetical protein HY776_02235 [Actinobacteria bacterium]|nr:hypothetical protein [Actinomycetota bacterium]